MQQVRYTQADGTEFDAWVIDENDAGSVLLVNEGSGCRIVTGVSDKVFKKPESKPKPTEKGKPLG